MASELGADQHSWFHDTFGVNPLDYAHKKLEDGEAAVKAAVDTVEQNAAQLKQAVGATINQAKQQAAAGIEAAEAQASALAEKAKAAGQEAEGDAAALAEAMKQKAAAAVAAARKKAEAARLAAEKKVAEETAAAKRKLEEGEAAAKAAATTVEQNAAALQQAAGQNIDRAKQAVEGGIAAAEAKAAALAEQAKGMGEQASAEVAALAETAKKKADAAGAEAKKLAENAVNAVEKKAQQVWQGQPVIGLDAGTKGPAIPAFLPGETFTEEVPIDTPVWPVFGGKVDLKLSATLQITASLLPGQTLQSTFGHDAKDGAFQQIALKFSMKELTKYFGVDELLPKASFTVEGKYSEKGVSVQAGFSTSWSHGTAEVTGIVLKREPGKDIVWGALGVSVSSQSIAVADYHEGNVNLANISVVVKGTGTVQPQWVKIIGQEILKDAGEDAALAGTGVGEGVVVAEATGGTGVVAGEATGEAVLTGGEVAAAAGGVAVFEAVLIGGLAIVAVGVIAGVADMIVQKINLDNLQAAVGPALLSMRKGLRDGLSGLPRSSDGPLYDSWYGPGHDAYEAAIQKAFKSDPTQLPWDIEAEVKAAAGRAMASFPGFRQADDAVRWSFFKAWVKENHGLGTLEPDAQAAIAACWGGPPESANGEHMKYWASQSSLPSFFKT